MSRAVDDISSVVGRWKRTAPGVCNWRNGGYEVLGVSVDDEKKHQRFIAKHELPFHLIADTEKQLVEQFGVWGARWLISHKVRRVMYAR